MFDVRIRFQKAYRDDEHKIGEILIPTMSGKKIPLREISEINLLRGLTFMNREGSSRYIAVACSIAGKDVASTILFTFVGRF